MTKDNGCISSRDYCEQDCIDALRKADEMVEGNLSRSKFNEVCVEFSGRQVGRLFGTWNKAKQKAGLSIQEHGEVRLEIPEHRDWDESEWKLLSTEQRITEQKKSYLAKLKVAAGCKCCGYDKSPGALSFHHRNPEEKSMNANKSMTAQGWKTIHEEVEKCDVLCANCHRIEHFDDGRYINL